VSTSLETHIIQPLFPRRHLLLPVLQRMVLHNGYPHPKLILSRIILHLARLLRKPNPKLCIPPNISLLIFDTPCKTDFLPTGVPTTVDSFFHLQFLVVQVFVVGRSLRRSWNQFTENQSIFWPFRRLVNRRTRGSDGDTRMRDGDVWRDWEFGETR
jgi:hypothetical protein